jgi:hypothetical protein
MLWKEGKCLIGVLLQHLPGRPEESHENLSLNSHCPDWDWNQAASKCESISCCHTNLLGSEMCLHSAQNTESLTGGFLELLVRWLRSMWLIAVVLQLRLFLLTATDTKAEFGSRKSSSSSPRSCVGCAEKLSPFNLLRTIQHFIYYHIENPISEVVVRVD